MEINGRLKFVGNIEEVAGQEKVYKKRLMLFEVGTEKYPKDLAVTVFNNETLLDLASRAEIGEMFSLVLDVSSKEYNGRYYHNVNLVRINGTFNEKPTQNIQHEKPVEYETTKNQPINNFEPAAKESTLFDEPDDLPF